MPEQIRVLNAGVNISVLDKPFNLKREGEQYSLAPWNPRIFLFFFVCALAFLNYLLNLDPHVTLLIQVLV